MTESTISPSVETTNLGFLGMVWGVLAKPRKTFATLQGNGRAWILMAILSLILITLPIIVGGVITSQQTREEMLQQFENQPGFENSNFDAEQAANVASSPIFTTIIPAVGAVFGRVIGWFVWSGVLFLFASMVGGRSTFLQVLQVVIWSWLPYVLRSIFQAIYITVTQSRIINAGLSGFAVAPTPNPSDPFSALPSTGTAVLQAFLGQIDIFLFWNLALLVIGITAVTQLSRRKSTGLVLIIWTVFMAVLLIITAVSTSLASGFVGG